VGCGVAVAGGVASCAGVAPGLGEAVTTWCRCATGEPEGPGLGLAFFAPGLKSGGSCHHGFGFGVTLGRASGVADGVASAAAEADGLGLGFGGHCHHLRFFGVAEGEGLGDAT
jgi:hypothetical protein